MPLNSHNPFPFGCVYKMQLNVSKCQYFWPRKKKKQQNVPRDVRNSKVRKLENKRWHKQMAILCLSTKMCPQRRQGPGLRPLWLLVGTPSAIRSELDFSRAEHSLPYSDVTIYIFAILYLSSLLYVYRFLWPLRLGWLLVWCLYKEVYLQIFKCVSFWLHGCGGEWEGWARKPG